MRGQYYLAPLAGPGRLLLHVVQLVIEMFHVKGNFLVRSAFMGPEIQIQ